MYYYLSLLHVLAYKLGAVIFKNHARNWASKVPWFGDCKIPLECILQKVENSSAFLLKTNFLNTLYKFLPQPS